MSARACLYLKAYGPEERHDAALARLSAEVKRFLLMPGAAGFFFVRFADPLPHLRLRFLGARSLLRGLSGKALQRRMTRLLVPLRVRRAVYRPETARYGGPVGLAIAEKLFYADSQLVLTCLGARGKTAVNMGAALGTAELMLRSFGLGRAARDDFFRRYYLSIGGRVPGGPEPLGPMVRDEFLGRYGRGDDLDLPDPAPLAHIAGAADRGPAALCALTLAEMEAPLRAFSRQVREVARELDLHRSKLSRSQFSLQGSYVHMHLNRFAVHGSREWLLTRLRAAAARAAEE